MTIELKPEHQRIVEEAVKSGRYGSVDEFIDEAFTAWRAKDNQPPFNKEKAQGAAARIRELRKGVSFGGLQIRDLINEGHP